MRRTKTVLQAYRFSSLRGSMVNFGQLSSRPYEVDPLAAAGQSPVLHDRPRLEKLDRLNTDMYVIAAKKKQNPPPGYVPIILERLLGGEYSSVWRLLGANGPRYFHGQAPKPICKP